MFRLEMISLTFIAPLKCVSKKHVLLFSNSTHKLVKISTAVSRDHGCLTSPSKDEGGRRSRMLLLLVVRWSSLIFSLTKKECCVNLLIFIILYLEIPLLTFIRFYTNLFIMSQKSHYYLFLIYNFLIPQKSLPLLRLSMVHQNNKTGEVPTTIAESAIRVSHNPDLIARQTNQKIVKPLNKLQMISGLQGGQIKLQPNNKPKVLCMFII